MILPSSGVYDVFLRLYEFEVLFHVTQSHDGSMVLLYMVTWIPSIYPSDVSIFLPAPAGSHGNGHEDVGNPSIETVMI
jgi:hypothetical protein